MRSRPFRFAAATLGVWALWALVVPAINGLVPWRDVTRHGDRIRVSGNVTFTPAAGWNLESGLRTTDRTDSGERATDDVVLVRDGVQLTVVPGPWAGGADGLLAQLTRLTRVDVAGEPRAITTHQGERGAIEAFRSGRRDGIFAAFAHGGEGIEITASGPPDQFAARGEDIAGMIETLEWEP